VGSVLRRRENQMARYVDKHSDPWPPESVEPNVAAGWDDRSSSGKVAWIVVGIAVLLLTLFCGAVALMDFGPKDRSTAVIPSPIGAPPPTKGKSGVGEGMFLVGQDMEAGTYKTKGMARDAALCYWHVAPDTTDSRIRVQGLANKEVQPGWVTLKVGDWFKTSGCQPWAIQPRRKG
jgi:hypothetical protein